MNEMDDGRSAFACAVLATLALFAIITTREPKDARKKNVPCNGGTL